MYFLSLTRSVRDVSGHPCGLLVRRGAGVEQTQAGVGHDVEDVAAGIAVSSDAVGNPQDADEHRRHKENIFSRDGRHPEVSPAGSNNMDWSLGLIPTNHHIFGSLAQQ